MIASIPSFTQTTPPKLDQDCVISILNRTVQVSSEGEWVMPNVPSTQGQVRARASCVRNGATVSGQSDYFSVPVNGLATIPTISFEGENGAIPKALLFSKDLINILGEGTTEQLGIVAQYVDDRVVDVTKADSGINYTSSNEAVVQVNADGLLIARSSGAAMVVARKDGVTAVINVYVQTSGDSDGDGLPDDYEARNGLDPNDPADASEDQDSDGLSALQGFQLGSDPQQGDTDGDGIVDGEEVVPGADGFVTSPILADTDGDGLHDGIEIRVGSDPTDAGSADYQAALASIAVTPNRPVIVYNTIDNESSVKLVVTGTLVDGSTVDLTSKGRGTTYISSDLAIANFGTEDGRIFAGVDGVAEIAITNAGHQTRAYITVETFNPAPIAHFSLPGDAFDVDVNGNHAFIAAGSAGLVVVDVSNAAVPVIAATLATTDAQGVRVKDGKAYVADGAAGVKVIDVSAPASPTLLGSVDTPGVAQDIAVGDDARLIVADGTAGLRVIDASNPSAPLLKGAIGADGSFGIVTGVDELNGTAAFVSNTSLYTALVTNPDAPLYLGTLALPFARKLDIVGEYAYVAAVGGGYRVVNIANLTAPVSVGGGPVGFNGYDVVVDRGLAFFADALFPNTVLPWVNVKVPTNPVYQGVLQFTDMPQVDTLGVDVSDNFAYLVGKDSLFIAQLRRILDANGVAPIVSLVDPPAGTVLFRGRQVTFRANATDDVHVASVSFLINGQPLANIKSPPWEFTYRIPDDADALNVQVLALDLAGNQGRSAAIEYLGATIPAIDEQWIGQNLVLDRDYFARSVLLQQSNITSANNLTVLGNMVVSGTGNSSVTANTLTVEGDLLINGMQLTVSSSNALRVNGSITITNGGRLVVGGGGVVSVGNDVSLLNASVISALPATVNPKKVFGVKLEVGGTVAIDTTSAIDLNGKGYPSNYYSGPDFSSDTRSGCHGGVRGGLANADCTYGRLERARFAGSAGYNYDANNPGSGGGLLDLQASALVLNGTIRANGANSAYNSSRGGGAGGGIHVQVTTLSGAGQFQANGGSSNNDNSYPGGAGGRISVYSSARSGFTGSYRASGATNGIASGAGTVYVKDATVARGNLLIDNANRVSATSSTPIRRVGRRLITGVYQASANLWRLEVGGSPWKSSDAALDWGIDGLDVDLDATETGSPLYRIVSNTANTLTINTSDNLAGVVGQTLLGVHTFETVRVSGGADVDFGEDRLVINNVAGSTIGANSSLRVGEVSQATLQIGGGGTLQLRANPALQDLTLNGLGASTLVFDAPVSVNALSIGSGKVVFNGAVAVGSGLTVAGGATVTFNGALSLGGNLSISAASTVTVLGETVFPGAVDVAGGSTLVARTLT
ncbi:MAG TPA: Ig-like domain-containing protein, partial [Steroidobacteraceae bacterium]